MDNKNNTVLSVHSLKKLFRNGRGVNNITLNVNEGDIVGLLGPNGSGKTTAMKSIIGIHLEMKNQRWMPKMLFT